MKKIIQERNNLPENLVAAIKTDLKLRQRKEINEAIQKIWKKLEILPHLEEHNTKITLEENN